MLETRRRSIVKALSWRLIATLITATVVFVMTGNFEIAAEVGLIDTSVKLWMFFLHERLWLRITYGRYTRRDYQI